ncbi:imidazole glycerol phosphate synthase subunit HisF [Aquirufa nivalisilvae]
MSKYIRVIPRLDIKGPNLVKGIHLEGLRVMGKPEDFAKYYYETGADELLLMDVVASLYGRNSIHEIITKTAKSIFIPITVGGGLRSLDDIKQILRAGADKVCLNTAAIGNPSIIKEASLRFGSSTIVVAIEAIKHPDGKYYAYTDNGREYTGKEVFQWASQVQDLGAGEIIITSVDFEGTGKGFDISLISQMSKKLSVPVIAHGGAGKVEDISLILKESDVDAVSVASILHYNYVENNLTDSANSKEGNVEFLKNKKSFSTFKTSTISQIKENLKNNGIPCRI